MKMRPIIALFSLLISSVISLGQEQVDLRIANVSRTNTSPDSLSFDVQLRGDAGTSCLRYVQVYLNYNTDAFGSDIASDIVLSKGAIIEDVSGQALYDIQNIQDNTSSLFTFTVASKYLSNYCGETFFSVPLHATIPSSFQNLVHVTIPITDGTLLPNITLDDLSLGQVFFQTNPAGTQQSSQPDSILNDLNVYPLENYDIIWDGSIWSGTGNGTNGAPDATNTADDLLVEQGTTDPLPGDATVHNLIILDGGTLDLGGNTLTITGSSMGTINGTVTNGTLVYGGSSAQEIVGETTWDNIEIDNANGVTVVSGAQSITGVLTPTDGTFTTGGNVTMIASGEGVYGQIAPGSGTISGDVTFQMYISAAGWHNLASPISSMTLADLEDDILINYSGNASGVSAYSWNASAGNWVDATANTDAFTGGWNIYIDNNFVPSGQGVNSDGNLPVILDLTGTINTGNQNTANIDYTASPSWSTFAGSNSTGNSGWNLIANPYPSNLDWSQVNKDIGGASINGYYYIWDPSSGAYVYHNGSAGSASRTATISPMQAIWVKLDDSGETGTTVFNFTDADRTVSSPADLLKTSEVLVLELRNASEALDHTQLVRELGYSSEYDASGDAMKQRNPGKANFYFITDDSLAVALNSIDKSFMGDTVMLGLMDATHGATYSIAIDQNTLPSDFTEKLVDLKTGSVHDLTTGAYTFTHDSAFGEHRFNLMAVSKTIGLGEETAASNRSFDVRTASNGEIVITFPNAMTGRCDLNVIDMAGRIIHAEENVSTRAEHHFSFTTNVSEAAVYVIRLRDTETDEVWSAKIVY